MTWWSIPSCPMGKYNPDWAVAFREGSVKHVYFVAKSKGNDLHGSQLRGSEESKIEYVRCHFKDISNNGNILMLLRITSCYMIM